jgi:hypothetical protein
MKPISAHWVTIPEEKIHTPASSVPVAKAAQAPSDDAPVGHKLFWGIGFVVMIVVATALLAPKETLNLLQGNLFETTTDTGTVATTTPDAGIQPLTLLPAQTGGQATTDTTPATPETVVQNDVAVVPQTDATTIQVEPISNENSALLEQLNQQVEAIKNNTVLEPVRPSAPEAPVVTPVVTTPEVITVDTPVVAPIVTPPVPVPTPVPAPVQTGYKPNTHTVTVTPAQMLAKNEATVQAKQGSAISAGAPAPTTDLSGVGATPDSGPREVLMMCLALTFLSMFGYKAARAHARR